LTLGRWITGGPMLATVAKERAKERDHGNCTIDATRSPRRSRMAVGGELGPAEAAGRGSSDQAGVAPGRLPDGTRE
jgi:hypothetical protein